MNIVSYWIGNYIYDFLLYLFIAVFTLGMCQVLSIDSLIEGNAFTASCLLFLFYGLSNIPLTYILGYLFKDYGNAQGAVYFFNFVSGGILTLIILVLRWISTSNIVGKGLAWPLRIIPAFSFG
jgi:ATP-binding cassette subfamily A (ABC1) protein 3